jgi:septation ring formation regulator EzrA
MDVIYCMDSLPDTYLSLQNKISNLEADAEYYKEQAKMFEEDMGNILNNRSKYIRDGTQNDFIEAVNKLYQDKKECLKIVESKEQIISKLKSKLVNRDFDVSVTPTTGKRKFSE